MGFNALQQFPLLGRQKHFYIYNRIWCLLLLLLLLWLFTVCPTNNFSSFPVLVFLKQTNETMGKKTFLSLSLSPSSSSSFFLFCRRHCLCLRRRRRCLDPRTLLQNFISSFLPLSYVFAAAKRKKFLPNFFSFLPFPVNACMSSFQSHECSSSSSSQT